MSDRSRTTTRQTWLGRAARGTVAAMAMSGMREVAMGLGMIERTPPEAVLREGVPALLRQVPEHRRSAAVQVAHWGYGATAGAAFGLVPARLRASKLAGPVYGVLAWGLFELVLAPALDLAHAHNARPKERAALLIDHVFFGCVVADRTAGITTESPKQDEEKERES